MLLYLPWGYTLRTTLSTLFQHESIHRSEGLRFSTWSINRRWMRLIKFSRKPNALQRICYQGDSIVSRVGSCGMWHVNSLTIIYFNIELSPGPDIPPRTRTSGIGISFKSRQKPRICMVSLRFQASQVHDIANMPPTFSALLREQCGTSTPWHLSKQHLVLQTFHTFHEISYSNTSFASILFVTQMFIHVAV